MHAPVVVNSNLTEIPEHNFFRKPGPACTYALISNILSKLMKNSISVKGIQKKILKEYTTLIMHVYKYVILQEKRQVPEKWEMQGNFISLITFGVLNDHTMCSETMLRANTTVIIYS